MAVKLMRSPPLLLLWLILVLVMIRLQLCDIHTSAWLPHHTHTHIHTFRALHTQILSTHSCSLSLSYSRFSFYPFLMLTCTQLHSRTHSFPYTSIHSKAHSFTHSCNTRPPPYRLSPPPPLPATLPLGSVSRNGLKELGPCT